MQTNEKKNIINMNNTTGKYLTRGVISADSKGELIRFKASNMLASALSPIAGQSTSSMYNNDYSGVQNRNHPAVTE